MSKCILLILPWLLGLYPFLVSNKTEQKIHNEENYTLIENLRDSLDIINYIMPSIQHMDESPKVLYVRNQDDWDYLFPSLKEVLDQGNKNVVVKITGREIIFGGKSQTIQGWSYPKASIKIDAYKTNIKPYGFVISKRSDGVIIEKDFYSFPFADFSLNDIILDKKGISIPFCEDVRQVEGDIEQVEEHDTDLWRFKVDLPDLSEEDCNDFYVLLTRDWTSARHKVYKIADGWLYFHLDSKDLHSTRNPNIDWIQYKVRPRYSLINYPRSNGVHFYNGRIYIPKKYKKIRIIKGGQLIKFVSCNFKKLELCGFNINGCSSDSPLILYYCSFSDGAFIYDNTFKNLSYPAIVSAHNENVTISNNTISDTRVGAIESGGKNTTIMGNRLNKIGRMLNTMAILGAGENLHICDNIIEDFNYSAIACGNTTPNSKSTKLTYIIERNLVRLSKAYTNNYIQNTLADGGGIYIGPQCTEGIIRNNVIENIKGIHSNRGIFLDDGAKNLYIYGNLVLSTSNSYDIDLRLSRTYEEDIPDHNKNNYIFDNILTGGYRFQDNGVGSHCMGGKNILLKTGEYKEVNVQIENAYKDIVVEKSIKKKRKIVIPKESIPDYTHFYIDPFISDFVMFK